MRKKRQTLYNKPYMPEKEPVQKSKDVVYFARTNFRNEDRLFGIKRKDRRQHMYVIGKTGTGKSVLLQNLIAQDIRNGEGLAVVDPHGELVEALMRMVPAERADDVVYFNPADTDYHIGFNPLEVTDPKHKHLVASGLMGIFTKIWANVWSARMEYILNNAVLALLDTPNSTLLGITRLMVDKEYRQKVIDNVQDPVVRSFWINEYEEWQDKFRNEAIAPIQNKVGQFLSTSLIRNVVGQPKSTIDIFDLMNQRKILLINVSKGRIGEDNSALLGAMLITKIQLASMERVRIPEEDREDFYLYVDEFQNFATDSFASVLSEARKYRLNLTIAHQYVGQLVTDMSTKVRDAVFGNTGTLITFRVGAADAEFLEKEYEPEFEIQDMVNLPNYQIYIRLMVDGVTRRPFSAATLSPFSVPKNALSEEEIVEISRTRYGRPKEEVEDQINRWARSVPGSDEAAALAKDIKSSEQKLSAPAPANTDKDGLIKVPCSVPGCDRLARLRFQPDPNRAVYCSVHHGMIQAGEMEPVRVLKRPSEGRLEKARSTLADMGIEFAAVKSTVAPGKGPRKRKRNRSRSQPKQEISLKELNQPAKEDRGEKKYDPARVSALKEELRSTQEKKD
ncbi:MAG: type IV secretion system DNA-binding domain-containing protein [Candidatus Harrisonbacteria bacterium]|nr:type IV secretion system DNA-binding domain-containing protein [Candidatus Harrisonbacteria bacterium]